jgi:hypothetical protein
MNIIYVLDFSLLKNFSLRGMFSDSARVTSNMRAEGHANLHVQSTSNIRAQPHANLHVQSTSNMRAEPHANLHVQSSLLLPNIIQNFKAFTDFGNTSQCHMPCTSVQRFRSCKTNNLNNPYFKLLIEETPLMAALPH